MIGQTPRATWLRERARACRAKAKLYPLKSDELLRMASAYEGLAERVPKNAEIAELLLKRSVQRSALKKVRLARQSKRRGGRSGLPVPSATTQPELTNT